jgi:DNA-binding transcriptional LysR family regulator
MHDLNDLFFFAQVVDKGGFTAAARALGIPKSRLSRRVAQLEERLGVRLMQRTTRRFTLTEVGEIYHRHCVAMLGEAEAAEEAVNHLSDRPRGTIRISCPIKVSQMMLASLLPRFMADYPEVRIHLEVTNRRIDLIEEGFDVAFRVRAQRPTEASLTLRMLGESRLGMVASPELIARHGTPSHPDTLIRFPTLSGTAPDGRHVWYLQGPDGTTVEAALAPRLVADDMVVLREAAVAGHGITLLPLSTCCAELATGKLKLVLDDWPPLPGLFYCVFPSRRGLVPAVRRFIDFVAEELPRAVHAADVAIKANAMALAGDSPHDHDVIVQDRNP